MTRLIWTGTLLAVLVVPSAWAAPCATACKDEIAACRASECQGLKKRALRHCKKACGKTLVHDCYADLTVCGATTARKTSGGGAASGGGGSGGGYTGGGW